jgi:tetratricopeptide (TPR) repeat protein
MQKYILTGAGCLIVGFFIGFFVSNSINRNTILQSENLAPNHPEVPFQNQQTQVVSVKEPNGAMMPDVSETLETAKKEPENFDAQIKAGLMYSKIQRADKALEFFNNAAALKPTDYDKIVLLGNSFFDIREFQKAALFYQQALEKKSDDVGVRTDLGITFVERQDPDYDRAIKEFQTSLSLNPKHEPTLYNLTIAYFKKGDPVNAQKYSAQLEQVNPNSQLNDRLKELIVTK